MEYRMCEKVGLKLSSVALGCWSFGGGDYWGKHDQKDADAIVRRAIDLGINFFDEAEVYYNGSSEEAFGRAIKGIPRDKLIIGTKVLPNNTSPENLRKSCEGSLRRMNTEYIDVYMVHWPIKRNSCLSFDPNFAGDVPRAEDAYATLLALKEEGKIRHAGVSNYSPRHLEIAKECGIDVAVNQICYNLLSRGVEVDCLPYCAKEGIGVIAYMPLLQGILADVFPTLSDVPPLRRRTRHFDSTKGEGLRHGGPGAEEEVNAALEEIRAVGKDLGLPMPVVALRWILANKAITCFIVGTMSVEELETNVKAVDETLPPDAIERLNDVTQPILDKLGPGYDYWNSPDDDRTL